MKARRLIRVTMAALSVCCATRAAAQAVNGFNFAHDPSTMITSPSGRYYIFRTDSGISINSSPDRLNWVNSGKVFPSGPPTWTSNAVPGFTGTFWAPDIVYLSGKYHLYYSCSTFGSQTSAIGLVTTATSLDAPTWVDQGVVIQSPANEGFNTIDPSVLVDGSTGNMWMSFGSFFSGIYLVQLDPATGKRIATNSPLTRLADNGSIEASCLYHRGSYYYLFVNYGTCCAGIDSTYEIRVARSTAVTGPYLDRNGLGMINTGAGTKFMESTGRFIGPGHVGIMDDNGTNWLTFHYYDGNDNGTAKLGLMQLSWTADDWPVVTNDWCAFYPFEADARDDLGQFNGQMLNGAVVTNEPGRGNVLTLDGATNYVKLPLSVANANTFAAWVKWNGGGAWQRLFDFGNGTGRYLFLTPSNGATGRMRFAVKPNGGIETALDGPAALPVGSWCHVAVTLDGTRGKLFLNGNPVATNNSFTARPWQALARSNYIGDSQFTADPFFNGRIDSFRIYGRTLSDAEILQLAEAHPSLAHRYSFTANARDSIGTAHGVLNGTAKVTNSTLVLDGAAGGYVNLPGGMISGCSAATLEFQAAFGANGNWARVFDFGRTNGVNGERFLYFTPHTGSGSHEFLLSTTGGTADLNLPGTFDGQTLHVVCIVDPAASYSAIYTNGVLESERLGATPALSTVSSSLSWIGRSLFSADAWLNATIDEFRIYHGRLTPAEIAADAEAGPDALAIPVSLTVSNSAGGLEFLWPAYGAAFILEASSSPGPGASWNPVGGTPTIVNDHFRQVVSPVGSAQYYRLRR